MWREQGISISISATGLLFKLLKDILMGPKGGVSLIEHNINSIRDTTLVIHGHTGMT